MTTYKEAGVDIENTDALVEDISKLSKSTNRNGNFDKIGGFGGIFDLKNCGYEDPLLVSGTDGIGTKILLGIETDILDGLGHDLVGMCLNDILCHGAEPLFFLDYYATGKLVLKKSKEILKKLKLTKKNLGSSINCSGVCLTLEKIYKGLYFFYRKYKNWKNHCRKSWKKLNPNYT